MTNLAALVSPAFNLLRKSPHGAALTVTLSGGGTTMARPAIEPYMTSILASTGNIRGCEERPEIDLRLYVEQRNDMYFSSLERITGLGAIASIPDPSEFIGSAKATTLDELEVATVAYIEKALPGAALWLVNVAYRKNVFTRASFEVKAIERGLLVKLFSLMSKAPEDTALREFVDDTVGDALRFDGGYPAHSILLWFTLGEILQTLYVTIKIEGEGNRTIYSVSAEDRARWPWKDRAISRNCKTQADVRQCIADYIAKTYSFRIKDASVYLNWS